MKEWYLRVEDGSVFGPVDTLSLVEWARQGRVAPGDCISEDGTDWTPAEKLPDLDMVWLVELSDGSYHGPVNIDAVAFFISEKTILPSARLINRRTNERTTVAARYPEAAAPLDAHGAGAHPPASDPREQRITELEKELRSTRTDLRSAQDEALEREGRHELDSRRSLKTENALRAQMERLQKQNSAATRRLEKAESALLTLQKERRGQVDWMASDAPEAPKESAPAPIETAKREAELLHRIDELDTNAQVAAAELRDREKALKAQIRDHDNLQIRSGRRQAELKEQIETLNNNAAKAALEIEKLKSVLADERRRGVDLQTRITAGETALTDERTNHEAAREEANRALAELAGQVEKFKTACGELAIQLRTARQASEQTNADHTAAMQAASEEKAGLLHQIESLSRESDSNAARFAEAAQDLKKTSHALETFQQQHEEIRRSLDVKTAALQQDLTEATEMLAKLKTDLQSERLHRTNGEERAHADELLLNNTIDELRRDLNEANDLAGSLEQELTGERARNAAREAELLQSLEKMKEALEAETVVPEILPPGSGQNHREGSSPEAHLADIEEQAQRELHAWQNQQGSSNGTAASMFASWKKDA